VPSCCSVVFFLLPSGETTPPSFVVVALFFFGWPLLVLVILLSLPFVLCGTSPVVVFCGLLWSSEYSGLWISSCLYLLWPLCDFVVPEMGSPGVVLFFPCIVLSAHPPGVVSKNTIGGVRIKKSSWGFLFLGVSPVKPQPKMPFSWTPSGPPGSRLTPVNPRCPNGPALPNKAPNVPRNSPGNPVILPGGELYPAGYAQFPAKGLSGIPPPCKLSPRIPKGC